MRQRKRTALIGIKLTPERLIAVELRLRAGRMVVGPRIDEALPFNVYETEAETAGREIRGLLEVGGLKARECVVCPPVDLILLHSIDLTGVEEADVEGLVQLEAERAFPFAPEEVSIAVSRYTDPDAAARANLAALPAETLRQLEKVLAQAGLRPVCVAPETPVLLETEGRPADAVMLVDRDELQFAVSLQGGVALMRSVACPLEGSSSERGDAQEAFEEMQRELRLTVRRLAPEVRRVLGPVRVYGAPDLREKVMGRIGPVFRSLRLGLSPAQIEVEGRSESDPAPGVTKMTARVLAGKTVPFDFWRPAESKWRTFLKRPQFQGTFWRVAAIAIAVVVLGAGAFLWQGRVLGGLEKKWAKISPDVEELQALQEGLRARRPWLSNDAPSLEILKELTSAFPEEGSVWARSLKISAETGQVECSGFARSNRECLTVLETLRKTPGVEDLQVVQMRGDNPVQFTVSYTWKPENQR